MKLTITTLVIIEGSYIQGIFHSLEEHPFHTNEKEYNYFLDTFTSTDKYEQIMEIYANPR